MKRVLWLTLCASLVAAQSTFPPELGQYLAITPSQKSAIEALESSFAASLVKSQGRTDAVNAEIAIEAAKPVVDPLALGVRLVEIETIRRQIQTQYSQLRTESMAALNDAQRALLAPLADTGRLYPLIADAYGLGLLSDDGSYVSTPYGSILFVWTCCGASGPESGLIPYLNLTDSQSALLDQMAASASLFLNDLFDQQLLVQIKIYDELAKDTPDPDAAGLLYANRVELTRKQLSAGSDLATRMQAQLTPDQKLKFKPVADLDSRRLLIVEASCIHLVDLPNQLNVVGGSSPSYSVVGSVQSSTTDYGCGYFR